MLDRVGLGLEPVVDDGARVLETRNVIVATGSVPRSIPGYEFDGERAVGEELAQARDGVLIVKALLRLGRRLDVPFEQRPAE